jgi:hypothetical protein
MTFEEFVKQEYAKSKVPQMQSSEVPAAPDGNPLEKYASPMAQNVIRATQEALKPGQNKEISVDAETQSPEGTQIQLANILSAKMNQENENRIYQNFLERRQDVLKDNSEADTWNEAFTGNKVRQEHNLPLGVGYNPASGNMTFIQEGKDVPKYENKVNIPYIPNSVNEKFKLATKNKEQLPRPPARERKDEENAFSVPNINISATGQLMIGENTFYDAQVPGKQRGGEFAKQYNKLISEGINSSNPDYINAATIGYRDFMQNNYGGNSERKMGDFIGKLYNWVKTTQYNQKNQDLNVLKKVPADNPISYVDNTMAKWQDLAGRYLATPDGQSAMRDLVSGSDKSNHKKFIKAAPHNLADALPLYYMNHSDEVRNMK